MIGSKIMMRLRSKRLMKVLSWSFAICILVVCALVMAGHYLGFNAIHRSVDSRPFNREEVFLRRAHLRKYKSSVDPDLTLWAVVALPSQPSCILVTAHGWHGGLSGPEKYNGIDFRRYLPDFLFTDSPQYLLVDVDMRGRVFSDGRPDASGFELQDWIDAVEFAKAEYAEYISDPECVYAEGGSGSGGNVYALVGRFPDYFAAAAVHAGMSDYARLYEEDEVGEFRDDMEGDGWIGGSPRTNPEGYRSRGGLTMVENVHTPIHIDHGDTDVRVPVAHARQFVDALRSRGRAVRYLEWQNVGDRRHFTNMTPEQYLLRDLSKQNWFRMHTKPPRLPKEGELVVAGFVKTKDFEVILDDMDRIGTVSYEIGNEPWHFRISAAGSSSVTLRTAAFPEKVTVRVLADGQVQMAKRDPSGKWLKTKIAMKKSPVDVTIHDSRHGVLKKSK